MNPPLTSIPSKPGVYIFRDSTTKPLYVGKANNLQNRVKSYFQKELKLGPRTAAMVAKIARVEHIVVESEIEALLLEADLIKRLKPKYNVRWKDNKAYKYIKISNVKNQNSKLSSKLKTIQPEDYAKVSTSRSTDDKNARYFGPFPEGDTVKQVLRTLRRIFPFRDCSEAKFRRYQNLKRPCLYGDLKLCPAPCVDWISPHDYQRIISQLKSFLVGRSKKVIREMEKEMKNYSKLNKFETAAMIRDRIKKLLYVTQGFRPSKDYLEHPNLLVDQRQKELEELGKRVGIAELERIEAYDISDIFGKYAVGSMVVFVGGEPSKTDHRRFKIRTVKRADDVGMIREIIRRRFKRAQSSKPTKSKDDSFGRSPDLVLIDGGKAQVNAVNDVLKEFGLKIPVLGLAKKEEVVIDSQLSALYLKPNSPALHLLQRVRDEAHRFAVSYHRRLRSKRLKI